MEYVDEEDLAIKRLAEVAKHHGWTHEQTIWRIINALVNGDFDGDLATLIWGIDFVASEGGRKYTPMLNATLPADRSDDELYETWKARQARQER